MSLHEAVEHLKQTVSEAAAVPDLKGEFRTTPYSTLSGKTRSVLVVNYRLSKITSRGAAEFDVTLSSPDSKGTFTFKAVIKFFRMGRTFGANDVTAPKFPSAKTEDERDLQQKVGYFGDLLFNYLYPALARDITKQTGGAG